MLSFPRGALIGGVPVTTLKAILRSIDSTGSFTSAIQLRSSGACHCDNAIAVDVAIQAGLVDPGGRTLTDLGHAVLGSTSKARLPRAKATILLNGLLDSAAGYNANPDHTHQIDEIWLFGSHARSAETVGDIDLAIRWSRKAHVTMADADARTRARYGELYSGRKEIWDMTRRLQDRDLFGQRRNAAFAVTRDLSLLIAMAEPCMKVFDLANGIIAAPALLDKHPEATVRQDGMRPRVTALDRDRLLALRPTPRPLPANWPCTYNGVWLPSPLSFALSPTTSAHYHVAKLARDFDLSADRDLRVYSRYDEIALRSRGLPVLPDIFDGHTVALLSTPHKCLALQRRIEPGGPGVLVYNLSLSDHVMQGGPDPKMVASEQTAYDDIIGYYLAALVYADALYVRALSSDDVTIHFFTAMAEHKAIEARMRYWTDHLVKGTPLTNGSS
ncbi:hypothetical protein LH128_03819 [Sphingomonas sp. LH128]|nr:hypothetical protein LH128_03819 [Sphingomonas sp. LH128]